MEREREQENEREVMSICEMVKTQKWYYVCNMRSGYFPIDRRLHREREQEREAMSICEAVKHRTGNISEIQDLHISLPIGDSIEREQERERGYAHL